MHVKESLLSKIAGLQVTLYRYFSEPLLVAEDVKLLLNSFMILSYRNQSIDLQCKSMDWSLYDTDFRNERVN